MTNTDTSPAALRKLSDIRHYLNEAHQFAAMSPRGKENIESALEILDELAAVAAEKEAQQHTTHWEPFVVKRYGSDERPLIKGNGFDGLEIGDNRDEAEVFVAWINERLKAQHRLEMVAPADVPLPEPDRIDDRESESAWSQSLMHQYAEAYAKAAVAKEREMREALELIAAPKRPDGTWNRDREACRQLAADALGRYDEKQKGTV